MKRICVALAVLAVVTIIVAGCGGGGGGTGGGGDITPKTTLSGRVINSLGEPVSGAQVAVDTGSARAILTGTTDSSGQYSIGNVPVGVTINISVTSGGNTTQLSNLTIGTDAGSASGMNVVVGGEAIPSGCTVHILPDPMAVYTGETSYGEIEVHDQYGEIINPTAGSGWKATVVVTGAATLQIKDSATTFGIRGGTVNQTAKITVLVTTTSGSVISTTQTVTIKNMDTPPGPPL
jgi:hypothetical protein